MISQQQLINNFKVSGSNITLTYEKYKTNQFPTSKLFVSNSSQTFSIQFYPTGSSNSKVSITTLEQTEINKNYPVTLPPKSGSNTNFIELLVNVSTVGLDNAIVDTEQQFNIAFNLVAISSSLVTSNPLPTFGTAPTYGGGGGGGGGGNTPPNADGSTNEQRSDNQF